MDREFSFLPKENSSPIGEDARTDRDFSFLQGETPDRDFSEILKGSPETALDENQSWLSNFAAGNVAGFQHSLSGDIGNIANSLIDFGRLWAETPEGESKLWMSTPEWIGMSQEEWDRMSPFQRRYATSQEVARRVREDMSPDEASAAYSIGKFTGMMADTSTLIPISMASKTKAALTGGAFGATAGATSSLSEQGEFSPEQTAIAAGVGAALPVGIKAGLDSANKLISRTSAEYILDKVNIQLSRAIKEGTPPVKALEDIKWRMNLDGDTIEKLDKLAGPNKKFFSPKSVKEATDFVDDWGVKRLIKEASFPRKQLYTIRKGYDKFINPEGERIKRILPRAYQQLIEMHTGTLEDTAGAMERINGKKELFKAGWLETWDNMRLTHPLDYAKLNRAALNGEKEIYLDIMRKHGMAEHYPEYRKVMDDIHEAYTGKVKGKKALAHSVGRDIGYIENYFPRFIKDIKGLRTTLNQEEKDIIDAKIAAIVKKKGSISFAEENDIYNKILRASYAGKAKMAPSSTKVRKLKKIQEKQLQYYDDVPTAIHRYVEQAYKDLYARNFFGQNGITLPKGGRIGDDYFENSIGELVNNAVKSGEIGRRDIKELGDLLKIEFVKSKRMPNDLIRSFKDLGYASFLGNPLSALTQLNDIPLGAFINGTRNTIESIASTFSGKRITPTQSGLAEHLLAEYTTRGGWTRYTMEKAFKWGGFKNVDLYAKNVFQNAAFRKYRKAALSKDTEKGNRLLKDVLDKWRPYYSKEELADAMRSFANVDVSKEILPQLNLRARSMVMADLMEFQPIATINLPTAYLEHPNGRVLYMFRTFSTKYFSNMMNSLARDFKTGHISRGIVKTTMLMAIYSGFGATVDQIKNAIKGNEKDWGGVVWDNFLKQGIITDRYTFNKLEGDRKPFETLMAKLVPPFGLFDVGASQSAVAFNKVLGDDTKEFDTNAMWDRVPVFGPFISLYLGDKYEENLQKSYEDYLKGE